MAYQLALPTNLKIHNVFHVSLLKNYVHDPNHMIDWNLVQVEPEGKFEGEPLHIHERREISLQNRAIAQVKVQWRHSSPKEAACELEGELHKYHLILF
jgi:hypothetical protein